MQIIRNFRTLAARITTWWHSLALHLRITLTLLVVLLVGLISSCVATYLIFFAVFGNVLRPRMRFGVEKIFTDEYGTSIIAPNESNGFAEELISPDGTDRILTPAPIHEDHMQDFLNRTQGDINGTLIVFLIITTLLIAVLGSLCVYFATRKSIRRVQNEHHKMINFIQDASHDLRTPLSSIQGWAKLLQMKGDNNTELVKIESNAKRMNALLNDMLLLAKLDSDLGITKSNPDSDIPNSECGSQDAKQHSFELNTFISQIIEDFNLTHSTSSITYFPSSINDVPNNITIKTKDDHIYVALERIIDNLLSNAYKYAPDSDTAVRLIGRPKDKYITIEVVDHGPGVAPEQLGAIFDRFTKVDNSRNSTGNGLGLAIVRELVVSLGGSVKALQTDEKTGKGLTVRVVLPV